MSLYFKPNKVGLCLLLILFSLSSEDEEPTSVLALDSYPNFTKSLEESSLEEELEKLPIMVIFSKYKVYRVYQLGKNI